MVFAKKPGGSLKLCIDYRKLNEKTIMNRYLLLRINDLFDQLSGAKVFSQLDLAIGFHQVRVTEAGFGAKERLGILCWRLCVC